MKKTALYNSHIDLQAKMVPFAGYEMPVTYQKISNEYESVRNNCGVFDVSHMGQICISGDDSISLIQKLTLFCLLDIMDIEEKLN